MTRQPFAHQDASGAAGARLAVFVGGVFTEYVNTATDPYGYDAIARVLSGIAPTSHRVEALLTCGNHPTVAAVDCLACDPVED
ncbi:hypothetical protein ACH4T9_13045 [Micromonospora sp. NPDC020750]|uniref:hypothetical protein n=1 Tax=unclassified Micromonospora TaxID=2617518 RepID=UPI0037A34AA3